MNKITSVKALEDGVLFVEFADGRRGEVDVKPYMTSVFFTRLKDPSYFAQVGLFFWGVGWPEGQDLGPDTLEHDLRLHAEST